MAMARPQTILVIGGGLGGLAFAQILRYSLVADKYRVIIFERDASPSHRGQGYQIGINQKGMASISSIPHIASVLDTGHKPHAACMFDGNLNLLLELKHGPGPDGLAGLVNRWKLREVLAQGLDVEWGKKFLRYEETETSVIAHFEDGTQVSGDLLVGADGVKSRVRAQRCPELQLREIPVLNVAGSIAITPDLKAMVPRVVHMTETTYIGRAMAADGNSVMVMEYEALDGEMRLLWSYSFPSASDPDLPTDPLNLKQAIDFRASSFGNELASLIRATTAEDYVYEAPRFLTAIMPMKVNPLGATSRVTLLGDAAHAMTPHRGLGANTAFADSASLVRALTHEEDPWGALGEYEEEMIKRGFEAVRQSTQSSRIIHMAGVGGWIVRNVVMRVTGWILWTKHRLLG